MRNPVLLLIIIFSFTISFCKGNAKQDEVSSSATAVFNGDKLNIRLVIYNNSVAEEMICKSIYVPLSEWIFSGDSLNHFDYVAAPWYSNIVIQYFNSKYQYPSSCIDGVRSYNSTKVPVLTEIEEGDSLVLNITKDLSKRRFFNDTIEYRFLISVPYSTLDMISEMEIVIDCDLVRNAYNKKSYNIELDPYRFPYCFKEFDKRCKIPKSLSRVMGLAFLSRTDSECILKKRIDK